MCPKKDLARLSILIPAELREKINELADFPYGNVTNAAKVLLIEALEAREKRYTPTKKEEIIQGLSAIEESDDLLEIASKAVERAREVIRKDSNPASE